jgi:hypothetical protein
VTPEQLVPSLEPCQQLKDAGWGQGNHHFYWYRDWYDTWSVSCANLVAKESIAAPTVSELIDWLRKRYQTVALYCFENGCSITAWGDDYSKPVIFDKADTPEDACAKAVLLLLSVK